MGVMATVKDLDFDLVLEQLKPAQLARLREKLEAAPIPAALPRPEMAPEERRALGTDLNRERDRFDAERKRLAAALETAWKKREAVDEEIARLNGETSGLSFGYTAFRDPIMARLWAERPALVDELIARCKEEATSFSVDSTTLSAHVDVPSDRKDTGEILSLNDSKSWAMPRTVSNATSVNARRQALRLLAEELKEWTTKGLFSTTRELQSMFDREYSTLPKVVVLANVMRSDVRGRHFVPPAPLPPAA